jgi:oligopeptide transport system substrate-binding protein
VQRLGPFAACVLVFSSLLHGCSAAKSPGGQSTLRRALGGEPATLDPGRTEDSFSNSLLIDLYEGLTSESPGGGVIAGVAESWTLDPSGTEYTFHLRADARWSNGEPVRAQDFVASWRRVIDPQFGSPAANDLRLVAHAADIIAGKAPPAELGVSASSDSTLLVKLERPALYFPQILSRPSTFPIYSTRSATTHHPSEWISNGPYILSNWQPTTRIDLSSNPYYWDRLHVAIPLVQYQFTTNDAAQYASYRAGQLDLTDLVPANALPSLRREHPSELVIAPFLATAYLELNLTNRDLSDVSLRRALAMAIDRKRLVVSLGFGQLPAYGLLPPGTADYTPQSWEWNTLCDDDRIAEAKRLYARAGYSPSKILHLRMLFNTNEVIQQTAILIAAMWKESLGVDVELTSEEFKVFLQSRHDKSRWDVARLAWTADFNDASSFLEVLRTNSANNDMSYASTIYDADLDKAASSSDRAERRIALQNAEQTMLHDYPIIPLYFFVSKRLVKPYVHGLVPTPLNHVATKSLEIDR